MRKIEEIKKELEKVAEDDFLLEMKSHWEEKHYKTSDSYHLKIQDLIKELEQQGITTEYRLGYEFEYKEVK